MVVVVVSFYIFTTEQSQTFTILNPSLKTYEKLYEKYSLTLTCPCTEISIPYGNVINFDYDLHQVCSSSLTSQELIEVSIYLFPRRNFLSIENSFGLDLQSAVLTYFQILKLFCQIAADSLNLNIKGIQENMWINNQLIPKSTFIKNAMEINESVINTVLKELSSIKTQSIMTTESNQFLVGLGRQTRLMVNTNFTSVIMRDNFLEASVHVTNDYYVAGQPCSCRLRPSTCETPMFFNYRDENNMVVSKFFIGITGRCIPFYTILYSNFDWWYNATQIDRVSSAVFSNTPHTQSTNLTVLDATQLSLYSRNSDEPHKFETLLDGAFIERWNIDLTGYERFFAQCRPQTCIYTIKTRYPFLVASIIVISIVSGLNKALRIMIPIIVWFIFVTFIRSRQETDGEQNLCHYLSMIK